MYVRDKTETKTVLLNYGRNGEVTLFERMLPWQRRGLQYTANGYGVKIPTRWVVKYRNHVRRVYCTIFSNIGTCWFIYSGRKMIVG